MLEVIGQDFIRTARAKGLRDRGVVARHALRNALIPVISVVGLQVGYLLSATALVEVVFSWPGLGSLLVQSVVTRDLPLAQGAVLVIALVYVLVNILTDLIQALARSPDPLRLHEEDAPRDGVSRRRPGELPSARRDRRTGARP